MRSWKLIVSSYSLKVISVVLLLISISFNNVFANPLADSASAAYSKQKYKQAIVSYEKILAEGKTSPILYFNLANSYYKNEQLGKAIYYRSEERRVGKECRL